MKKLRYALLLVAALLSGTFSITPRAQITQPFGWSVVTITSTGSQNNYAPPLSGNTVVRCNNASLLTLTGLTAGYDGQHVKFVAINAQIDFVYSSASSSTGNKFINYVSSGNTSITTGAGSGYVEYVYDATSQVWRLTAHEQGAWITPTYNGAHFTGNVVSWTVDSGDVGVMAYYLKGRVLQVAFTITNTSTGGATSTALLIANGQWGGFTSTKNMLGSYTQNDNNVGYQVGLWQTGTAATTISLFKAASAAWASATNTTAVVGVIAFEVT